MKVRIALLIVFTASTTASADELPLFLSSEPLHLTLEFPVRTLLRQKKKNPELEGTLRFSVDGGETREIAMTMTTRGKSRLDYCSYPPLTLNLKKKQTEGTVFAGQDKLKVVTHCKSGAQHQRYLLQEYGIYRGFNVVSEYSYRVRMLKVTYADTVKRKDETHDAFFIESHNEAAARHAMERARVESVRPEQLNARQAAVFTLFQYLAANTDWSMLKGPGEEGCCHNGKVIITPGTQENWVVLPYDFDQSGVINTKYSMPADGLRLKSVRQRLYRGRCIHNDLLPEVIAMFNEKRPEIEAAMNPEGLGKRTKTAALRYINEFYETVNDPAQREKKIFGACLGRRT